MSTHLDQNALVLDQFSKQAERYAALVNQRNDPSLQRLLEAVRPMPSDRMLDVGCGTGRFAVTLAPLVTHVVGVDLTARMLDQARKLQADTNVPNIEWQQCDVTRLPFADGSFTLVTSKAMLHHVTSPLQVIAEMRRVCVPGGRILVVDLTPMPEKSAAFDAIEILRDPSHAHAMTQAELRGIGDELGLVEIALFQHETRMPLETVLQTSFPPEGMLERVRNLYRLDARSGANSLGFGARLENDEVFVSYPMSTVVWQRV